MTLTVPISTRVVSAGLVGSNPRHVYEAAGKCIYCGSAGKPGEKLGEEHIIPLSFGGNLLLPEASCRACERITTKIEDHCFKGMVSTARPHLGIRGRQKRKNSSRGPVYIDRGSHTETRSAPLHEHPGALIMPIMPYPAALLGATPLDRDAPLAVRIAIRPMTPDLGNRAYKVMAGQGINLTKGLSAIQFYRLIAKIAHAFTAAELGADSFIPCLLNLIRGQPPMFADHFVGTGLGDDPRAPHLHEVRFVSPLKHGPFEMLVVRIRLFASLSMPTHYAVSGAREIS